MHECRNTCLIVVFLLAIVWSFVAWLVAPDYWPAIRPSVMTHKIASLAIAGSVGVYLIYALKFEDKYKDDLAKVTMGHYFERDGLCFMPLSRIASATGGGQRAEISLYYQNRFDSPCEAVIHLRAPDGAIFSHHGGSAVHFAFRCAPGAFGVIHQPVAIRNEFQGRAVDLELAAAIRWPRGHGDKLRSHKGTPCGTFDVDWALAYRQSAHELGGDIELKHPAKVHIALPENVDSDIDRGEYRIEVFAAAG